jgi:hypothetical protein
MSSAVFQNLIYALDQVIHNFGAAAVIGFSSYGLLRRADKALDQRSVLLALAIAWAVQGVTGVTFGITSLSFYGKLPDIHGVAVFAVTTKIICVVLGFIVALAGMRKRPKLPVNTQFHIIVSFALGAVALTSAAFLRWFS